MTLTFIGNLEQQFYLYDIKPERRLGITIASSKLFHFFQLPLYQPFRQTAIAKEQRISYQIGKITFNEVIDLVGKDWVYANARQQLEAHIAYLRHDYIHTFTSTDLQAIAPEIKTLVAGIEAGDYTASPTLEKCAFCPYLAFCDYAMI